MTIYIAGPMRGYPLFNFPAFDEARDRLRALGYQVISPADLDRMAGFDPECGAEFGPEEMAECVRRDVDAIIASQVVVLLPGWKESRGARAEKAIAEWMSKGVYELDEFLCGKKVLQPVEVTQPAKA